MQSIIAPWRLITDSWKTFIKTWDTTVRISVWFVVVGVVAAAGALLPETAPGILTILILNVVSVVIALWASIRLYQTIFAIERGETISKKTTATAIALIWPVLIVQALAGIATLGALILLILPGIYVGVRFAFSQVSAIDPKLNKRGKEALKESWMLTKDRFWSVFGRFFMGGILFGVGVGIVSAIAIALVGAAAGPDFASALTVEKPPAAVAATLSFIQGIVQAALMPIVPIFQVKLFESLKSTR